MDTLAPSIPSCHTLGKEVKRGRIGEERENGQKPEKLPPITPKNSTETGVNLKVFG